MSDNMTQKEFDRRFDKIAKAAFALMFVGILLAFFVGLPAFLFFDRIGPHFAAVAVAIFGATIMLANFTHDILCNPRWKR